MYEAIVKGQQKLAPGTPESFNVLVKELQGLCLDIKMIRAGSDGDAKLSEKSKDKKK
jgi:DNA-directed RNA polymerase subunit beta